MGKILHHENRTESNKKETKNKKELSRIKRPTAKHVVLTHENSNNKMKALIASRVKNKQCDNDKINKNRTQTKEQESDWHGLLISYTGYY